MEPLPSRRRCTDWVNRAISTSRPTRFARSPANRRVAPGRSRGPTTRNTFTGSCLPFTRVSGDASRSKKRSTRVAVSGPISTWPPSAKSDSREATFTTSPNTPIAPSSFPLRPVTTTPVLIPVCMLRSRPTCSLKPGLSSSVLR